MRPTLQRALRHPWTVAALSVCVLAVVAMVWACDRPAPRAPESSAGSASPGLTEAPLPLATEIEALATPEPPSPFAGIAQPPPAAVRRTTSITHTVAEGDVLWQIAEQYNLRTETILWANDVQDPNLLLIGQHLTIPPVDGVTYTVRPGDTIADVAVRYGVEPEAVVSANGLQSADQIQAGTDIFLPGGRPLATAPPRAADVVQVPDSEQTTAASGPALALPDNIDQLLGAGWLSVTRSTDLFKSGDNGAGRLHQIPPGVRLERLDGFRNGRIQVRDPGDGRTRQAMSGWITAADVDVGRAPATRELPLAYPADTAMDISHVFAPYRSQLDGSPFAEANCGPTTIGMALDAFGVSVPPRQLRAAALDAQHMYGNGVGTLITALAQVVQQNGLSALDLRDTSGGLTRWSLDQIRAHLHAGHPVVVQVRYRSLPGRGGAYYFGDHYILVTGVLGDGFLYNDPIDIDGLGWDRVISGPTLRNAMNASASQYAYSAFAVSR